MKNEKNKSCNSFFESVAHHNLERFHSETIAWIFKTFPNSAKNFIKSIHTDISSIEEIELELNKYCWAELNQIDILLKYSYNSKNYQIIIENKMKASEHKIEAQKLLKKAKLKLGSPFDEYSPQLNDQEIKFLNFGKEVKLSQTEYYYFREKLERAEQIVDFEINNDKPSFEANPNLVLKKYISERVSTTQAAVKTKNDCIVFLNKNINDQYCRYVYLKPSRVSDTPEYFTNKIKKDLNSVNYYFDKLNAWNKKLGDNQWITITYEELIKTIKNNDAVNDKQLNENIIIANAYINFIEDNIKEEVYLDDFNKNKEYARFDYFKLLFALVKTKFKDVSILNSISNDNKENSIYEYIEAGSSNGGMPLFAFYKEKNLDVKHTFFSYSSKDNKKIKPTINVGIQVQGENFKYYVSAGNDNYDNTKVNNQKNYREFCIKILIKITEKYNDKFSAGNKYTIDDETYNGFHPNSTKTFYSRSYKIINFIASEKNKIEQPSDIFSIANEISEKVNHFVNFDITNSIETYE